MNLFCVKFRPPSVLKVLKINIRIFNMPAFASQTETYLFLTVPLMCPQFGKHETVVSCVNRVTSSHLYLHKLN